MLPVERFVHTEGTPDLTPDELEALQHCSQFGRPASAGWSDKFTDAQTQALLRGFPRGEMEDKWIVYSDDLTVAGATSVYFHRSWTGSLVLKVDLQLTDAGSRCTCASWETDPAIITGADEQYARETFLEVCRWVLRFG